MRSTWLDTGRLSESLGLKVKVIFFVGSSADETDQEMIRCENSLYGDIVQSDFPDEYMYNSYKVMSFLR